MKATLGAGLRAAGGAARPGPSGPPELNRAGSEPASAPSPRGAAASRPSGAGGDSVLGSGEARGRAGEGRPVALPGAVGAMPGVEGTARRGQPGPCGSSRVESGVSRSLKDSRGLERASGWASRFGAKEGGFKNIWLCFSSCARSLAAKPCQGAGLEVPGPASGPAHGCAWVICPEFVLLFYFTEDEFREPYPWFLAAQPVKLRGDAQGA